MKKLFFYAFISAAVLTSCGGGKSIDDEANEYADKYCKFFDYNKSLMQKSELTADEKKKLDELQKDFDDFSKEMEKKYAEDKENGPKFMQIAQKKMAECGSH